MPRTKSTPRLLGGRYDLCAELGGIFVPGGIDAPKTEQIAKNRTNHLVSTWRILFLTLRFLSVIK
jgi:hypothetical protein